ncbi:MAG: DUF4373 domain-containing protein [Oscillospiraceae bacterium]
MARPRKKGLDYFPLDVDFFSDKKIKRLRARYGTDGVTVYMYLLCEIYRSGYYINYDEDLILDISDELNISENSIQQIINYLLSRSLFDDTLAKSVKVLTAASIQRRYQEAKNTRKSTQPDIDVEAKFWVLKKDETHSFIKVRPCENNSQINIGLSANNSSLSEINGTKESKVKKSKVKESKEDGVPPTPAAPQDNCMLIFELYNRICRSYPRITQYSEARKKAVKASLKKYNLKDFERLFKKAESSNFLKGKIKCDWRATFDWLIKDTNMAKVLDGNYDNRSENLPEQEHSYNLEDLKAFVNDFGGEYE